MKNGGRVNAEVVAIKWWKSKTQDYHQKVNARVASRIAERFKI